MLTNVDIQAAQQTAQSGHPHAQERLNKGRLGRSERHQEAPRTASTAQATATGSPIVDDGAAIGLVVANEEPHPRLAGSLPAGLLQKIGVRLTE